MTKDVRKDYYPPMHTAEHILNQTMIRLFNCNRCFSSHIKKKKSKCDYHFNRCLTIDEIKNIEVMVNEIINRNLEICEENISRIDAERCFNLNRLPKNSGDFIRVVNIGNYDSCPCIGEHVTNTSEIGKFRIVSFDYNDGVLRIRYKIE